MQIRQTLEDMSDQFTPAERQLVSVLLADYPFAGLEPIQELSKRAHISAPSISRFVAKLGCAGFQDFQQRLVQELKEGQQSPIDLRDAIDGDSDATLSSYVRQVESLNQEMIEQITSAQFTRLCELLTDPRRRIFMIGGRMSDSIAEFFVRHLRQIRPDVSHIPSDPELWPEYLLRMRPRDVLLLIDFRRYQSNLARLSAQARARKAQTVVITDKWISPAAKGATELVSVPIHSGTVWDSYVPAFTMIEAMLVAMAERNWDATRARISQWDKLREDPAAGSKT
ncbi:MurR/RpiR family transcriptional regulator [Salipiger abyssi]|uniref:MurR/RpiR family transcriptional regulator n=1 Tax=Salipiger abyssi TaxID=1250539 RepID=UPI001A8F52FD|nr:MurR/RpiR family transcriptional regulator [Salipiger abyssi]MBN9890341.1 MurR/RpiR family transcriptional regulator [Salipiger abyssi]